MNLQGKVAIVTAGGRGIGRGIAMSLADAGADLVINSFSDATTADTARAIRGLGRTALEVAGDITRPEKMLELVESAIATYGRIDILVNNVGAAPKSMANPEPGPLGRIAAVWDGLYQQNLRAVVLMTEAVKPHLMAQSSGKIINIASIAGRTSLSDRMLATLAHPSYGAMKAGLIHYTQTLAELLGPNNINVNAVCPGIIYTDVWRDNAERAVATFPEFQGQDARQWFEGIAHGDYPDIFDRTPLRREQTVEDVGRAVVFLASADSMNITGQSLMVDGGMVKI